VPTFGGAQVHVLSMHEAGAEQFSVVHWYGSVHTPFTFVFGARHLHESSTQVDGAGQLSAVHRGGVQTLPTRTFGGRHSQTLLKHVPGDGHEDGVHCIGGTVHTPSNTELGCGHVHWPP
jgi:hypothetical protein